MFPVLYYLFYSSYYLFYCSKSVSFCDYCSFRDRFRTSINVLGDAFGAGIVAHLSRHEIRKMDMEDIDIEISQKLGVVNTDLPGYNDSVEEKPEKNGQVNRGFQENTALWIKTRLGHPFPVHILTMLLYRLSRGKRKGLNASVDILKYFILIIPLTTPPKSYLFVWGVYCFHVVRPSVCFDVCF